MGVRVNDADRRRPRTANGVVTRTPRARRREGDLSGASASDWCDYSGHGRTARRSASRVFDDPKNPRPGLLAQPRLRPDGGEPVRPGRSGFPDTKGKTDLVKLAKGEHLKLRYGLLLHTGDAKSGQGGRALCGLRQGLTGGCRAAVPATIVGLCRRGGRVVECVGLESSYSRKVIEGIESPPSPLVSLAGVT